MQIRYFLHTQPAELGAAHGAGHVVAGTVVHLDDKHAAARTHLQLGPAARPAAAAAVAAEGEGDAAGADGLPLGPRHVAGLVRMPLCLAVIAEAGITSLPGVNIVNSE